LNQVLLVIAAVASATALSFGTPAASAHANGCTYVSLYQCPWWAPTLRVNAFGESFCY
jgi:hypothetical protein